VKLDLLVNIYLVKVLLLPAIYLRL